MTTVVGEKITAVDLKSVVMLNSMRPQEKKSYFTEEELAWQHARANRKIEGWIERNQRALDEIAIIFHGHKSKNYFSRFDSGEAGKYAQKC